MFILKRFKRQESITRSTKRLVLRVIRLLYSVAAIYHQHMPGNEGGLIGTKP